MSAEQSRRVIGAPAVVDKKTCVRHDLKYNSYELHAGGGRHIWTECPKCLDEREQQDDWHRKSGAEGRFSDATFDTFAATTDQQCTVLTACRDFVKTMQHDAWRTLWLIGPPGTGKTHLGAAMVHACIYGRLMNARIQSARQIVREIRSTWRKDSEKTEEQAIRSLAVVPLLVIDEVGIGSGTDSEMVSMFDVIDQRYQLKRPTVLLSNLNVPAVQACLGDRMFDRMRENSTVLVCDWVSHRQGGSR